MSLLTLPELLAYDPAPDRRAMRVWQLVAGYLDELGADLARSTNRLAQAWTVGAASEVASGRSQDLVRASTDASLPARRLVSVLDDYASTMSMLRHEASSLAARTPDAGGSPVRAAPGQLEVLLVRAREVDDRCAAAIRACLPDPASAAARSGTDRLSRGQVQAQASGTPAQVAAWWRALTVAQRGQALAEYPDLVGRLDGVPALDRDRANRANLAALSARLDQRGDELLARITANRLSGRDTLATDKMIIELTQVRAERAGLDQVRGQLDRFGAEALLLTIDPTGDGLAIIALGNPDTARHTAVWVPGVSTDLGDTGGNLDRVANLRTAADGLTAAPGDVASVMWLGYDTPDAIDPRVLLSGRAEAGGQRLDTFIDGLRAAHDGTPSHVTAVGHSYGTVVIAEAAVAGDGLAVQDIVVAGSPGMGTDQASDLHVDPRHVWAGSADDDLISGFLGHLPFVHGDDPTDDSFGANEFVVDTDGHSAYWTPGSASLANQARIVTGRYQDVTLVHGGPPNG